jgi:hypothetical protein
MNVMVYRMSHQLLKLWQRIAGSELPAKTQTSSFDNDAARCNEKGTGLSPVPLKSNYRPEGLR